MKRKVKLKTLPIIMIFLLVIVPTITVLVLQKSNMQEEIYAEEEVYEELYNTIPVISHNNMIINPYSDGSVKIAKQYYDYKGEEESQKNSIVVDNDTYYQNTGIDFSSDKVFDVLAIKEGTVLNVREDDKAGITVEVKHNDELISIYQSLSEVTVKKDDVIVQGQLIGRSGTNKLDKDLGNHLHFEIYKNGISVNPENYLNKEYKGEN